MNNRLITIKTFNNYSELTLLQSLLESEGIECVVQDELSTQLSHISQAIGGVKLQVWLSDIEPAKKIMIEHGYLREEDEEKPSQLYLFVEKVLSKVGFKKTKPD